MSARSKAPDFYRVVESAVRTAVARKENWDNGELVWNFVDADVFMSVNPSKRCEDLFYDLFNEACETVEGELA